MSDPSSFATGISVRRIWTTDHRRARLISYAVRGFTVGHDPDARTPRWVIERLRVGTLNGGVERTDDFRPDPDLLPGRRAELVDYVGSGFDRGHMAAAGNLTWSLQAMVESFYL